MKVTRHDASPGVQVENRLQQLLNDRDLSQGRFARNCDLGEGHINKICRNQLVPGLRVAFKISVALGLKVDDVFYTVNGQ